MSSNCTGWVYEVRDLNQSVGLIKHHLGEFEAWNSGEKPVNLCDQIFIYRYDRKTSLLEAGELWSKAPGGSWQKVGSFTLGLSGRRGWAVFRIEKKTGSSNPCSAEAVYVDGGDIEDIPTPGAEPWDNTSCDDD